MNYKDIINYCILFIALVLLQVLICNHIAIFNVAIPIIFIYFIIRLPISLNLSLLFTLSFTLGLIIDIFSDTPGVNALSCTLLASLKRPVFYAYMSKDDKTKDMTPALSSMGWASFSKYLLSMTGIYCLIVFSVEFFNFADLREILIFSTSSCLLTFIILLASDCLIISKS